MATQPNLLKIQEVSQRLHVPTHTLRFWEKELDGIIVPHRTVGGQRLYSDQMIAVIEEIKGLRQTGMSLAQIKAKFKEVDKDAPSEHRTVREIDLLADRVAGPSSRNYIAFLGTTMDRLTSKHWKRYGRGSSKNERR